MTTPEHDNQLLEIQPNAWVLGVRIEDTDRPGKRIAIHELMAQVDQMDISDEQGVGHRLGIFAAQLTLNYLDHETYPVHERAIDIGMLAMLGCYITEQVYLTPAEMEHIDAYPRLILFTRVLDDVEPEAVYSSRNHPTITSRSQERIRYNLFGYSEGREGFRTLHATMVNEYTTTIRSTPPAGTDIPRYHANKSLSAVVDRFVRLRRSLLAYGPELAAQEEDLWRYARTHYARYLM